ncbi:MAG: tRNA dihydrouridine synthase DusB [Clostridiales bacterium]|jgi:nifR3 family TIM-barrel protein|nr:tRNA dihydrouridine synthase DusB [Clostridiales bacterium]
MLAPMAGVTDMPFRALCREMGCDMAYTEMVSASGLYNKNAKTKLLLETHPQGEPCGAQLFGGDPAVMAYAAAWIENECAGRFTLIDINMGCPAHKITRGGEGGALMKNPALAGAIVGRVADAVKLPVTVKIRAGWDKGGVNAVSFARVMQESGAAAVCVHGRTAVQQYCGKADWGVIGEVKAALTIPVWGNGDIFTAKDALMMRARTGIDGVLVARGALGNPFLFREIKAARDGKSVAPPAIRERVHVALRHAAMMQDYKGARGMIEMRKHIAWYMRGCKGCAILRGKLQAVRAYGELEELLLGYLADSAR